MGCHTLFKGEDKSTCPSLVDSHINCLHSWWSGANIPGKKVQPLSWAGGLPTYMQMLDRSLENHYQGWHTSRLVEKCEPNGTTTHAGH